MNSSIFHIHDLLKKCFSVGALTIAFVLFASPAYAVVKYWIGSAGGSFASNSNWSTTNGGANDTTAPGSSDVATFDSGGTNDCTIDSNISVSGINILSGYSGTITQNSGNTITISSGHFAQAGGTFTGGNSTIDINSNFTLSGGTFTATSGSITPADNFTVSGGTFNHNNGTVYFDGAGTSTIDVTAGGLTFYNLTSDLSTTGTTLAIGSSGTPDTITVVNTLTLTEGDLAYGTVNAQGSVVVNSTFDGNDGANIPSLTINGAGVQAITVNGGADIPAMVLNNASATISTSGTGTVNFEGTFSLQNGVFNSTSNSVTFTSTFSQSGGTFGGADLGVTHTHTGAVSVSGGTYNGNAGSITINNTLTISGGVYNATSGVTQISNNWTHTAGGTFNHNNGTVRAQTSTTRTWDVATSETFYNFILNYTTASTLVISSGDSLIVTNDLTLTDGAINTGTFEVQKSFTADATLDGGTGTISLTGSTTATSTITVGADLPALTINNANATVDVSGSGTATIKATDIQSGTLNGNTSNVTFSSTMTVSGGTFNAGTGTITHTGALAVSNGSYNGNASTIDLNNTFTLSGGTFNATSGSMTTSGAWTHTAGGTFNHNNGTITVDGITSRTYDVTTSETFYNLTINATSGGVLTITSGDSLIATNALTLTDGTVNTGTLEVQKSFTAGAGFDGGTGTISLTGSTTATSTITVGTTLLALTINNANATVDVSGSGTATIKATDIQSGTLNGNTSNVTFSSTMTVSGGTFNAGTGTITHTGALAVSNGSYNGNASTIDLNNTFTLSGGTFNATSGSMTTSGAWTHTAGGTFNHNNGTITIDGITTRTYDVTTSETFYNLTINATSGGVLTITSGDTLIANNTLTLTDGIVNTGSLEGKGNVTVGSGFDGGTSPLTFSGSANQNFDLTGGTSAFNASITINKSGGSKVALLSALDMNANSSDLTIQEGTFDLAGNNLTMTTTTAYELIVEDGGNLQLQGGETITTHANFPTLNSGSTVTFTGSSSYTLKNYNYHHLTFNGSGTYTLGAAESVAGNLTITSGNFDLAGQDLTVTGTFSNDDTLTLQGGESTVTLSMDTNSGTIVYNGGSTYNSLKLGNTYYSLTFNNGAGTWKPSSTLDINGNLAITAGTLDSNGQNITIAGNWGNAGTFTAGTRTVTFDGTNQTITGTTTFNNITKTVSSAATLTFPTATTTTISGTATFQGASGQLLSIRSDVSDTRSPVNFQGSTAFKYLDVKDNNNTNASSVTCNSGCTNSLNNLNWNFTAPTIEFSSTSSSGSEATAAPTIAISLSESILVDTTVNYTISGTATGSGTDYTLANGTATITAGSTSVNITPSITNDAYDEDNETIILTLSSPSNASLGTNTVHTYTITDDDATPTVTIAASAATMSETGGSRTITATLSAASGLDVTVNLSFSGTATNINDYTRSSSSISINAGATTGSITLTAVSDSIDEDNETIITDISSATNATESGTQQETVTITDDDNAPSVAFSSSSSSANENAGTVNVEVSLSTASGKDVTVPYTTSGTATGGTDHTLANGSAIITAGNTTTNISVPITSDAYDEDNETVILTIDNPTNASLGATTEHTLTINDDDATPSLSINDQNVTETEASQTMTFTITLSAASGRSVTVDRVTANNTATSGSDYTALSSATITFNAGETTKTVDVTILGDSADEDDETFNLNLSNATNATISDNQGVGTITDDDNTVSAAFSSSSSSANENAGTVNVAVSLSIASDQDVTIPYIVTGTATGGADHTLANGSVIITASNTTTNISVPITSDAYDENNETIILTLDTPTNATLGATTEHTLTITDDDTAGVSLSQSGGTTNVTEGGVSNDSYTIVLDSKPQSNVTITLDPYSQVAVDQTTVTFTPSNWNIVQTITVTAVNDSVAEGAHTGEIGHSSASADSQYNAISIASVLPNITDNDTAGVSIVETSGSTSVTEGGSTDTYTVALTSQPTNNVTINVSAAAQATVDQTSLTFTSGNWNVTQTITVTAVNDSVAEGAHNAGITHSASSSDTNYNGISINSVTAAITDNDSASITISHSGGSTNVTEAGSTDTYTIVLTSQPTNDVTVNISDGAQLSVDQTSLTFTSANWNTTQTITVTATNDNIAEGAHNGTITHNSTSSDPNYNNLTINNLTVGITDNDTAGVSVAHSGGNTSITEGGATDSYTVVLSSEPTHDVTISITSTAQANASISSATFTTANWNTPQTVTVTAVNDLVAEGNHNTTLTHSGASTDTNYQGISISGLLVSITDNDSAGVSVTESASSTAVAEGSGTDTYQVVLSTQPSSNVVISLNASNAQIAISPSSLTFTSANWSTPQTVTVSGVLDNIYEGNHASTITHTATSSDTFYNAIGITSVTVLLTDDDTAGLSLSESSGSTQVTEGAATDSYTLALTSEPTSTVTITITGGGQLTASPNQVTFTTANWNTIQTITVSAISDDTVEGTHSGTLVHSFASSDSAYNTLTAVSLSVQITDYSADETNEAPTVSAGSDQTVVFGQTVNLSGSVSDDDEDSLTTTWSATQNSSCQIDITIAQNTSLSPTFTAPETAGCVFITLTASDGEFTSSDSMILYIAPKNQSIIPTTKLEQRVMSAENGITINQKKNVNTGKSSTRMEFTISNSIQAFSQTDDDWVVVNDDKVFLGDPHYDNDTGRVIAIDPNEVNSTSIDLDDDLDNIRGIVVATGSTNNSLFGSALYLADVNGDGEKDLSVLSTGTSHGTIHVLDRNTLEPNYLIVGSSEEQLKSKLITSIGTSANEIDNLLFGLTGEINLNQNGTRNLTAQEESSSFNGIIGGDDLPSYIDFTEDSPDFTIDIDVEANNLTHCDLNDDGYDDAILTTGNSAEILVYLGSADLDGNGSDWSEGLRFELNDEGDLSGFACSDVTGDGYPDLIAGFPEENDGVGLLRIIPGRASWTGFDIDAESITISGSESTLIGEWIITGDYDGDGVVDIYTGNGENEAAIYTSRQVMLGLDGSGETSGNGLGNAQGGGGWGCILSESKEHQNTGTLFILITLMMTISVLRYRKNQSFSETF